MKLIKLIYNSAIYGINLFMYVAHLEGQKHCKVYARYDFSKDLKYLK